MSRLNILARRTIVGNLRGQRIPKGGVRLYVALKAAAGATYLRASLLRDHFAGVDCGAILPPGTLRALANRPRLNPNPAPSACPQAAVVVLFAVAARCCPWERLQMDSGPAGAVRQAGHQGCCGVEVRGLNPWLPTREREPEGCDYLRF
jgi:hypothetical protein